MIGARVPKQGPARRPTAYCTAAMRRALEVLTKGGRPDMDRNTEAALQSRGWLSRQTGALTAAGRNYYDRSNTK